MALISKRNVRLAAARHPLSLAAVERWTQIIETTPARSLIELRRTFPAVDQVGGTLIFNIGGNNFRMICCVSWSKRTLWFRDLLTHAGYDDTDVRTLCP